MLKSDNLVLIGGPPCNFRNCTCTFDGVLMMMINDDDDDYDNVDDDNDDDFGWILDFFCILFLENRIY